MIHITEKAALKSDSDRSLRSYYGNLKDRINNANIDITELTKNINSTLDMIDYMAERLEGDRQELIEYIEEERVFLPEKGKGSLNGTLDTIREVLEGSDIKDIRNDIENESKCLSACQACFTATYDTCVYGDSPFCNYTTCTICVSSQTGCQFCDSDQNACVVEDVPCDYTSPCTPCYSQLYNTCKQEQVSCNYSAGCANCQNSVSTCNNCQGTVGTCSSCYGGSFGTCGEGQMNECGESHASCISTQEIRCRSNNDCTSGNDSCTRNVGCLAFNNVVCPTNYRKGPPAYCETGYKGNGESCGSGYNGSVCTTNFENSAIECKSSYGNCSNTDGVSCVGTYKIPGLECGGQYSVNVNGDGEEHCTGGYTCSGGQSCPNDYVEDSDGNIGCRDGYPGCAECYGTSYGCSGCYDVEYCSKCDAAQTTCNTCVNGQTTCNSCVKGEEGHQEDVCSNCYGGCQSSWEAVSECLSSQAGMPSPGGCTICVTCQVVHGGLCTGCDGGCQGGNCSPGDASCGVANCGAANCGSANCGTSNCGTGQCNQSGCDTCDDVSACVCSHTGSYGCNFPFYNP